MPSQCRKALQVPYAGKLELLVAMYNTLWEHCPVTEYSFHIDAELIHG